MNRLSVTMLMAATAIVPAAAQTQQDEAERAAACVELVEYVEAEDTDASGITAERANQIAERNDPQLCDDAYRVATGEISRDEMDENYDADATARLAVIVPEPDVTVEQEAPQVEVEQARPDVEVTPGRPVVTVNQAEPNVTVELAPPRITIDIPKPEIVVEMPDPTVDVAMREPRVSVTQPEPNVEVEQGEVRLQMGDETTTGEDEQADIDIEQDEATVQLESAENADVNVQDVEPDVRYNAAEPRIDVQQRGEPEITFNQSGDANVQIRQMSREETIAAAEDRMAGGEAEIDNTEAVAQAEEEMSDEQMAEMEPVTADDQADQTETAAAQSDATTGMSTIEPDQERVASQQDGNSELISVERLLTMPVIGADGATIGDIEEAVMRGEDLYLIVGNGGFLGLGEKQVALPMSDMQLRGDELVMISTTEDQVERMREVNMDEFQPTERDDEHRVSVQ